MIVKCEQCQTRFKIPDDKVTDKGVKVRCTKCGHTFRVTRETAPAAAAAPAASPTAVTAKAPAVKVPLDSADPFSKFGGTSVPPREEQTRPGVFALGVEASRMPDLGRPVPPPPAPPTARPATTSPFDFQSLVPPPPPSKPAAPAAQPAPFDFASLVSAPASAAPAPAAPPPAPAPFDFSALTAPAPVASPAPPPPPPRTSAPARPIDAPPMSFDFSSLGPPPPAAPPPPPSGPRAAAASPKPPPPSEAATIPSAFPTLGGPPPGDLLGDIPSPTPGGALLDDPFASAAQPSLSSIPADASKEEARNALFDMAAAAPPMEPPPPSAPPSTEIVSPPPGVPRSSPSNTAAPVPRPPDPATERGRRALGLVVNVLIAAVLVVGLVVVGTATVNEGKLDLDAMGASLKALVTPASDFTAEDISNGLYDTKMGRPVFFVRGVVTNRSGASTRVRVRAEILDGATLVRSAEVVAGSPPSPEELFRLAEATEVKVLMERASTKAPAVEAGGAAPFLVTFAEYPPDLKAFRVRVTARPEGQPTAAATP